MSENPTVREGCRIDASVRLDCHHFADTQLFAPSLTFGFLTSRAETRHHPFINLPRDAHVVQIIFTDLSEFTSLIQLEDAAAFDFRSFARFDPQRPCDV